MDMTQETVTHEETYVNDKRDLYMTQETYM